MVVVGGGLRGARPDQCTWKIFLPGRVYRPLL